MAQQLSESLEKLEAMEKKGFELFGDIFKDTLTYQIIQRKKKEASVASDSKRGNQDG